MTIEQYKSLIDHAAWALFWCLSLWSLVWGGLNVTIRSKGDK